MVLLAAAIPVAAGAILSAGRLAGASNAVWVTAAAVGIAFAAGRLRQPRRPPRRPAGESQQPDRGEIEKLTFYIEFFFDAVRRQLLGEIKDIEDELLIWPAEMIARLTGGSVQLAVLLPVAPKEGRGYWQLAYSSNISRRECREFEVALKDSYLERMQVNWGPSDKVQVVPDLQAVGWRKAGSDLAAFAKSGYRMLRAFPFSFQDESGKTRPCIALLSKDPGTFSGFDDIFLVLLAALLSTHPAISEQARSTSEGGQAPE